MENFEEILRKDLHQFLLSMKEVDERMPECPDAPASGARHEGGIQRLCCLLAPALPVWGRHATETNGLSHDKDELKSAIPQATLT